MAPLAAAAKIAYATGKPEVAARLLGTYLDVTGAARPWLVLAQFDTLLSGIRRTLGDTLADEELRRGAHDTAAQALRLAVELIDATA